MYKNLIYTEKKLTILTNANGGHFRRKSDEINEKGRAFFQKAESNKHLCVSKNRNNNDIITL